MNDLAFVKWSIRLILLGGSIGFVILAPGLLPLKSVRALTQRQVPPISVSSLVYRTDKATAQAARQNTVLPSAAYGISPALAEITTVLAQVDKASLTTLPPQQLGVKRPVGAVSTSQGKLWENHDRSSLRVFAVKSPGALGIRVHFANFDLREGDEVYVYGSSPDSHVAGPFSLKGPAGTGEFWSESLFTDTVIIEHLVKGEERGFQIPEIAHIFQDPMKARLSPEDLPCELDASCSDDPVKNSVGRYDFVTEGGLFLCTGTLINDQANDEAPYFLTANHCINTEPEAQTVEVFWFYQTASCNSGELSPNVIASAPVGANLLVNDNFTDQTLLSITGAIPNGVVFSGWNTSEQTPNTPVFGLDCPGGAIPPDISSALKRAVGNITDLNAQCTATTLTKGYTVNWTSGLVEPGASGSGIWVTDNGQDQLVGVLSCGSSTVSCDEPGANLYGRFADFYPLAQKFLQSGGGCNIALSAPSQSFGPAGGTGSVNVITTPQCSWSVSVSDTWIAVTSGVGGSGNGTVTYAAAANPTSAPRTATITIGGQTYSITEGIAVPAQTAELSLDNGMLGTPLGAPGFPVWAVNRLTPASYPATIGGVEIYFSGFVNPGDPLTVLVGANLTGAPDITGTSFSNTFGAVSGINSFSAFAVPPLTINSGDFIIGFTATSEGFPISIDTGATLNRRSYISFDGNRFVILDDAVPQFPGNIMIRALVNQGVGSCGAMIAPTQQAFTSTGGSAIIAVNDGGTCKWTAATSASWITVSPLQGEGSESVSLTVAANTSGPARAAAVTIAGQTFLVTQPPGSTTPSIGTLAANLNGDKLTLTGTATDPGADITQTQLTLLDGSGTVVNQFSPVTESFGSTSSVNFTLTFTGLSQFPQAVTASLVLIDASGGSSAPVNANFGGADPGGPTVTSTAYKASTGVLTVKGTGFSGSGLQVLVNGTIVVPPQKVKQKAAKLKIMGTAMELGLNSGFNNVRITVGGLRSNLFVFSD
jgi:hypothetical protein